MLSENLPLLRIESGLCALHDLGFVHKPQQFIFWGYHNPLNACNH